MVFTTLPHHAYPFCIHNKMSENTFLNVTQILSNKGSNVPKIDPGFEACCSDTDPSCNENAEKNTKLLFQVSYEGPNVKNPQEGLRLVWCPAGGHIEAKGKPSDFKYEVYDPDQKLLKSYS
ncbi:hypothetical protein INT45_012197 [Circinella minor]|uniref:Uncharacterized protein n=1 Tax=Circinella minor TaxID=1195481 RepID=A0A8H7RUF9_9FUNG|nr:hypothetical protein INT45_012197 [Circinella minor]